MGQGALHRRRERLKRCARCFLRQTGDDACHERKCEAGAMAVEIVAVGGVDSCAVDVKNIFKHALLNNASYIICFHNHPSGYTLPSREDEKFTERLVTAGRILNLPMIDHIIVGDDDFYSFRENGKLEIFPESDAVA